jgi:hypothetical protein
MAFNFDETNLRLFAFICGLISKINENEEYRCNNSEKIEVFGVKTTVL